MPKANAQFSSQAAPSGDVTRSRLLAAAASLVAERGWGSVTTRAVAARAGVNQALVHYHFGNMQDLLREAVIGRLEPEVRGLIDELLDERPVTESIHRVMALLDRFELDTEVGVLMAEAMLQATRDDHVGRALGGLLGSWAGLLEPRLSIAQHRGVIRDDIAASHLALVMAATLDGFLIQRMADPGLGATEIADTLVQMLSPGQEDPR